MSATHGFSIAGVVEPFAHIGDERAHRDEDLCPMCGRRLTVCACEQFDLDLRGDQDGPASYAWLAEREAIAHWEETR